MNKTELIDAVAKDSGLARTDAARAVDSVLGTVMKAMKKEAPGVIVGDSGLVTGARFVG